MGNASVVKVKNVTREWDRGRAIEFTCGDVWITLSQFWDGTWDMPISDEDESYGLNEVRDMIRCLTAAARFIEKDQPHWDRKCGGE